MAAPQTSPFDIMRRRIEQQGAAAGEQQQDLIRRKLASQGMSNSGAALKISQKAATQSQEATQNALGNVDIAESQERTQREEAEKQRQFAAEQNTAQRTSTEGMFNRDMDFKKQVTNADQAFRQMEFQESMRANAINAGLAFANLGIDDAAFNKAFLQAGAAYGSAGDGKGSTNFSPIQISEPTSGPNALNMAGSIGAQGLSWDPVQGKYVSSSSGPYKFQGFASGQPIYRRG